MLEIGQFSLSPQTGKLALGQLQVLTATLGKYPFLPRQLPAEIHGFQAGLNLTTLLLASTQCFDPALERQILRQLSHKAHSLLYRKENRR